MKYLILLLFFALFFSGCGNPSHTVLEWPSLKILDHEVEALEGMLEAEAEADPVALAAHLEEVKEALDAFFASGVPVQADNRELVLQKVEELRSLADKIGEDPGILPAIHPLVAAIMKEAGMPHVHEEHNHQDHHDVDHDHSH
jgi:hypothetical protein